VKNKPFSRKFKRQYLENGTRYSKITILPQILSEFRGISQTWEPATAKRMKTDLWPGTHYQMTSATSRQL